MAVGLCDCTSDWDTRKKSLRLAALIRCGQLCRECRGGECRDTGRKRIECVECHGKGCERCVDGHEIITGCPQPEAGKSIDAIRMFELVDKGHLPVAGGLLDQAQSFVEAYRFYSADVDKIKAELS